MRRWVILMFVIFFFENWTRVWRTDESDAGSLNDAVSAKHVVVTCEVKDASKWPPEFDVKIVDVSRNGASLNGERMEKDKYYALADGDMLTLPFQLDYRFELNPEGTIPRATRAPIEETATPLQKKRASPASASARDDAAKRTRDSDVIGSSGPATELEQKLREMNEANEKLRTLVQELQGNIEQKEKRETELVAELERTKASSDEQRPQVDRVENEALVKELEETRAQRDEAKSKIEVEARARADAEERVEALVGEKVELETKLQSIETAHRDATSALEKQHADAIANTHAQNAETTAKLNEEITTLKARVAELDEAQAPLRHELKVANTRVQQRDEHILHFRKSAKELYALTLHMSKMNEKYDEMLKSEICAENAEGDATEDEGEAKSDDDGFDAPDATKPPSDSVLADVHCPPSEPQEPATERDDEETKGDEAAMEEEAEDEEATAAATPKSPPLRSVSGNTPRSSSRSPKRGIVRDSEDVIPMNVFEG